MRFTLGLIVVVLMGLTMPARAHHSHGLYEDAFTDVQGVVKEIHFLTPHSFIYI